MFKAIVINCFIFALFFAVTITPSVADVRSIGAGFFINHHQILTNKHVVRGCKSIQVRPITHKKWFPAELIATDKHDDLAVIKTIKGYNSYAVLGHEKMLQVGQTMAAPLFEKSNFGQRLSQHKMIPLSVVRLDDLIKDNKNKTYKRVTFFSDNSVTRGDSGSPIFNQSLYLVGIITSGHSAKSLTLSHKGYGTDTLIASLPLKTIERFLRKENIGYKKAPHKPYKQAFTVQILCNHSSK